MVTPEKESPVCPPLHLDHLAEELLYPDEGEDLINSSTICLLADLLLFAWQAPADGVHL